MSAETGALTNENLREWLRPVEDPEIHASLLDLGLIYGVEIDAVGKADITLTLTSPGCPMGPEIVGEVKKRAGEFPGVTDVDVKIVWEPKWDPATMATDEIKDKLGIW